MRRWNTSIPTILLVVLTGCATVQDLQRFGIVSNVYQQTAPGLFIEHQFVDRPESVSTWVRVDLVASATDGRTVATALVVIGESVQRGDAVRVHLASRSAQPSSEIVSPRNRVVEIINEDSPAIAGIGMQLF